MGDIKDRFAQDIGEKLAAARPSSAKTEMIEEMADNLARRYEDMTAAGMEPEDAYGRAMEELGSVEELTAYLESLEPEPAPDADGGFRADMDGLRRSASAADRIARELRGTLREIPQILRAWGMDRQSGAERDGEDASREGAPLQQTSIPAEGVLRLDVKVSNGDVDLFVADRADAPVRVEGDSGLEIFTAGDGTLIVRERDTDGDRPFSIRGASDPDVSLTIPARRWESVRISTVSGDVDAGDELEVGELTLRTVSGDLDCRVRRCQQAQIHSVSGDVHLEGEMAELRAETVSGEMQLEGMVGEAHLVSVSGEMELTGCVNAARARSISGDVRVESAALPAWLELSSKSGDVEACVPDSGPFSVQLKSASGQVHYGFPRQWAEDAPADGDRPRYTLTSVSGDVSLRRYKG